MIQTNLLHEKERPAYKLHEQGASVLSDAETLSIFLKNGNINDSKALEVARSLMTTAGNNIRNLGRMTVYELQQIPGITKNQATIIKAVIEIGKRYRLSELDQTVKVSDSKAIADIMKVELQDLIYEEFWIILLSRANTILKKIRISQGGITGTVVDPKIMFRHAVEHSASGIVMCHNHPSGNLIPSDADISLTKKISDGSKLFDITLLDHIIIAGDSYYSFADNGRL